MGLLRISSVTRPLTARYCITQQLSTCTCTSNKHRALIGMKILKFTETAFYEQILLQSAKSSRFLRSLTNGTQTQFLNEPTKSFHSFYLALFRQENSDFENEFIEENILEVLFVQYLPESNCGFVRFLCLKYVGSQSEKNSLNFDWGKRLIEEAEINLNKVSKLKPI